jgi:hypothetical protein
VSPSQLARLLALALIVGAALLGAGALFHPMLMGDAASQLRIIADTSYWRALHLAMLCGSGLVVVGIWARLALDRSAIAPALIASLAIISVGLCLNALNIAFMAGSGWHMGAMFAAGRTDLAPIFEATHPIGLMAARFGNFVIALGALLLGWAESNDRTSPRWMAWLAWIAGIGGLVGVICFDEASRAALGAVALLSAWEIATVVRAFAPRLIEGDQSFRA